MWARGLPNSLASLSLDFTANTWAHNLPLFFSSSRRPRLTKTVVLAWWPATASLWFSRSVPPSKHHIFKKVLASPFGRPWPSPTFKRLQSRYQQSCMTENCWEIWGRRIWGRQAFLNFRRPRCRLMQTETMPRTVVAEATWKAFEEILRALGSFEPSYNSIITEEDAESSGVKYLAQ